MFRVRHTTADYSSIFTKLAVLGFSLLFPDSYVIYLHSFLAKNPGLIRVLKIVASRYLIHDSLALLQIKLANKYMIQIHD